MFRNDGGEILQWVLLCERDSFSKNWNTSWSYPYVDSELEKVVLARISSTPEIVFFFHKHKETWIYSCIQQCCDPLKLPSIQSFSIHIGTKIFNPEKYEALIKLFMYEYQESGSPTMILKSYLSVFTTCRFSNALGSWNLAHFQDHMALLANCSIQTIFMIFKQDALLIWIAMLLKKRIAVLSENLTELLTFIRVLPQFVWHRQDWEILRPYCILTKEEIQDLSNSGVYCIGSLSKSVNKELYDVLIDVPNRRISIQEHCQEEFSFTSYHDNLLEYMNTFHSDTEFIRGLALKTKELINGLTKMSNKKGNLTIEDIQTNPQTQSMEKFLFGCAIAEDIIQLL